MLQLQAAGSLNPGLALDLMPVASGKFIKQYYV